MVGGAVNTAKGFASVALGESAIAANTNSAVLAFTGGTCRDSGAGTVTICASGGFFVNGVDLTSRTTVLFCVVAALIVVVVVLLVMVVRLQKFVGVRRGDRLAQELVQGDGDL